MTFLEVYLVAELLASQGEWVTREDTGQRVCQLTQNIISESVISAEGWCARWSFTPPQNSMIIPSEEHGWIRCRLHRCQLHIEGKGWR
jgi:hypothetical protein